MDRFLGLAGHAFHSFEGLLPKFSAGLGERQLQRIQTRVPRVGERKLNSGKGE